MEDFKRYKIETKSVKQKRKVVELFEQLGYRDFSTAGVHLKLITYEDGDKVYVNVKGISSVPSQLAKLIDYDLVTPVGISFEDVTVESLKAAGIRGSIIKKIKQANNYQGSKMQKAIEAYEALNSGEDAQGSQETQKQPNKTTVEAMNADADDDKELPF